MKTCPTSIPFVAFNVPSFLGDGSPAQALAEICKLLDLKITIPICIDIVRIVLIAADDDVSHGFDRVIGNNPNVFQADGTGKSDRCAGDVLNDGQDRPVQGPSLEESLNLDFIRLMVSPYQHGNRVFPC